MTRRPSPGDLRGGACRIEPLTFGSASRSTAAPPRLFGQVTTHRLHDVGSIGPNAAERGGPKTALPGHADEVQARDDRTDPPAVQGLPSEGLGTLVAGRMQDR